MPKAARPDTLDLDILDAFAEITFAARGRVFGLRPGAHASRSDGSGGLHAGLASLLAAPDPRRIDLRATFKDPFETVWIKRQRQQSETDIIAMVDCSGSMGFEGKASRPQLVRTLVAGLAHAASRSSDRFGLILAGGRMQDVVALAPSRRRFLAEDVFQKITEAGTAGQGCGALLDAVNALPHRRSTVLLISDFAFHNKDLNQLLDALSEHDVRPVVIRDSALEDPDPSIGLLETTDLENGRRRLLLMRPALAARWKKKAARQLASLNQTFAVHGLVPLHIRDQIDPQALFEALSIQGTHP